MKKIKLSPSILSADFSKLGEQIKLVEPYSDYLHIDVMDGHFVPNITIGVPVVASIKKITKLPLDVHLMISEPEKFIESFANAGADLITVHAEVIKNAEIFDKIKSFGKQAGISLNPETSLRKIEKYLDKVDMVLVMSVNPGFSGQGFIDVTEKIKELRKKMPKLDIEIDGGINLQNAEKVIKAGANILVTGNAIFKAENPAETAKKFKELLDSL